MSHKPDIVAADEDYLFLDLPPFGSNIEYFDVLVADQPLYALVSVDENQAPTLFLEHSALKGMPSTCRLFFRKADALEYLKSVSASRRLPEETLRVWESKFSHLAKFIPRLDATMREKGRAGLFAVATVVHRREFKNIDIFWTARKESMV